MTLEISTEEFRRAAASVRQISGRLAQWGVRASTTTLWGVNPVYLSQAMAQVASQQRALERVCADLELLANRYEQGESSTARTVDHIARGALAVLSAVMPGVYSQLLLMGVLGSNTRAGVELAAQLIPEPQILAGLATLGGGFGLFATRGVHMSQSSVERCLAPAGFDDLFSRVPQEGAQIRIERIVGESDLSRQRFIVYIAGTKDFGIDAGSQPWDMSSNALALSGIQPSDSEVAVRAAMAQAGIDSRASVMFVGHSQGGLIASRLTASGDFNVSDLVMAGAPTHAISIPAGVRVTALEHTNDIVPALSGPVSGVIAATGASLLRIRQAYEPGIPSLSVPAHGLSGYRQTAREMDASRDKLLVARREQVAPSQDGAECSATEFTVARNSRTP